MKNLENLIWELSEELDIPESYYEKAETSYKSFASWLEREESKLKDSVKEVFLQGSFKLGTVIKPINETDEYDIDMVCKFDIDKKEITQKKLKDLLGQEVKSYAKSKNMVNLPEESKRCWTLNYEDSAKFHVDILPAIPDNKNFEILLNNLNIKNMYSKYVNAIPDNTSMEYEKITNNWEITNPHGYYLWFNERMDLMRKAFYESATIEEIPEYKRKTILQRVIQVLKRHRDMMFETDKPSSIIITTLAAHSYNGEERLKDAIVNIINNMEKNIHEVNGEIKIYNPVNPLENFADKWKEDGNKKSNFYTWLEKLKNDFEYLVKEEDKIIWAENDIGNIFGKSVVNKVYEKMANNTLPDFSHKKSPAWKLDLKYSANVIAYKEKRGYRRKNFYSEEELAKGIKLTFEVKTDVKKPYDVYWQVTNSGKEAKINNSLRGEFYECETEELTKGWRIRRESTQYTGFHTVECFIVKNNVCVAKSFPFIVNIIDGVVEF